MAIRLRLPMAQQRGNSGFTMMEMMLTLALVSIILSITVPRIPEYRQNSTEDEIASISYLFQGAQMNAIASGEAFTISMNDDNYSIKVLDKKRRLISSYELKTCRLLDYGMKQFTYKTNGDTNAFGTVYLSCGKKEVKFVFQIQKGRFRIEQ